MQNLSPPNLATETPAFAPVDLQEEIENLFQERYRISLQEQEGIRTTAKFGDEASYLRAEIGDDQKAHVFEIFIRNCQDSDLFGGLDLLIDYLDGVLKEFFQEDRNAFFPLDFTSRDFESKQIWVRHEFHHLQAESLALELLKKSL